MYFLSQLYLTKNCFSFSLATSGKLKYLKHILMIFQAIYFLVLIFIPSSTAEEEFCKRVFAEKKLENAFKCHNSTAGLTNLTKESGK